LMDFDVCIALIAYEAGPTGFVLARALEDAGLPVLVAAPSRIPRPVTTGDSLDSLQLAEMAMRGSLKPIAMPTETEEAQRSLIRRIDQIGKEVRRTKQRIKSLLLEFGIQEPEGLRSWSNSRLLKNSLLSGPWTAR
jgi:transposase